jgi:glycosyltransferase involved in cell wall biosynthesis
MKDHDTYLAAASILSRRIPNARFVIVGDGPHETKRRLADVAVRAGIADSIIWLGARTDMPAVYSAFDVAVSSSAFGEGFSNTLGEAMACEVPCVTTDVGDGATIVGDTGRVVPPRDPGRLADGLAELAADDRVRLGEQARSRIQRLYSVDALARGTAEALVRVSARVL